MPGWTQIIGSASVHITEKLRHSCVAGAGIVHIEVACNKGREIGYSLSIRINQLAAVNLPVVAKAIMGVHNHKGFSGFLFFQYYIGAYAKTIINFVPATGLHLRCVGKPKTTPVQVFKFIFFPKNGEGFTIHGFVAVLQVHIIAFPVVAFEM